MRKEGKRRDGEESKVIGTYEDEREGIMTEEGRERWEEKENGREREGR